MVPPSLETHSRGEGKIADAKMKVMQPLPRRRRSQSESDSHSSRHSILEHQDRRSASFESSSGMAEEAAASFNPPSTSPGTQPTNGAQNTHPKVKIIRQRRQGLPREHSRRAFTNPVIPAIGEESEDDLSMGIPHTENSRLGNKKRRATEPLDEPDIPATTLDGAASTPSTKRQRTSGSASSTGRSFSESLASMSPSPKKMEALEYKATLKRRDIRRRAAVKRMGDVFQGDGHLSQWLDDLRTSALRRPSQSLRREIHNTTVKLRKMNMDDAGA
ncbi:MAG: hypothetical protein LQ343_006454 [Gyalolechia ehrenbergii]|nr:MAG: hypothetical protein LQ343_006454 [Gyalolechia ehrenbergii]